jgi:hypothetical protein
VGHLAYQSQQSSITSNTVTRITPQVEKDLVTPSAADWIE